MTPGTRVQSPVCVVVQASAKPGSEESLKTELMKVAEYIRANPQCLDYRVYQQRADPTKFVFWERWTKEEAGEENLERKYMIDYIARTEDMYQERTWEYYDEVHPVAEAR